MRPNTEPASVSMWTTSAPAPTVVATLDIISKQLDLMLALLTTVHVVNSEEDEEK